MKDHRRGQHVPRRWRIHGQASWTALGQPFALGAGYQQTIDVAHVPDMCWEPGCRQVIEPGDVYVAYWRAHGIEKYHGHGGRSGRGGHSIHGIHGGHRGDGQQERYCLAHAPVAVELG